jgi:hypothetical protein
MLAWRGGIIAFVSASHGDESGDGMIRGLKDRVPRSTPAAALEATGFVLFFLMLFVPAAYQPIKAVLLALVSGALAARILIERRIALHPTVAFGCLLFSVLGLVFILRGFVANAPGALRMSTVYVIWPWAYTLMLTGLAHEARLWRIGRLLAWATIAICLYCASFILWSLGMLPDTLYIALDQGQRIGFYQGMVEFTVKSLGSLVFLVPFVTAALLAWPSDAPIARRSLWLALALGLCIGLLSGRRALQLVLVLGLPIALAFRQLMPQRVRDAQRSRFLKTLAGGAAVTLLAVLALQATYGLRLDVVWTTFKTGFQFTVDPVAQTRARQFEALVEGWRSSPLLGSGHGAPAPGVIRSAEMPWAYELTYLAFLYHTGLVGFLLHGAGVAWIYVHSIRIIRAGSRLAPLMVAVLTGTTAFLVANATNPYLERYDFLWVLFLPLAFVNCSLLVRQAKQPQPA